MSLKLQEKNKPELNLLDLKPAHNVKWKQDNNGRVVLFKPKFKNPILVKHLLPRMKKPHYKVTLDDIGSFFWKNCNGCRTIKTIAKLQKEHFGEKVEPLYERISSFLQSLERNGFIKLN